MNNPRGPMVPHEMRARYDRARIFENSAATLMTLAREVKDNSYNRDESNALEEAVVNAEYGIKMAQIEIKRMKDEPTR